MAFYSLNRLFVVLEKRTLTQGRRHIDDRFSAIAGRGFRGRNGHASRCIIAVGCHPRCIHVRGSVNMQHGLVLICTAYSANTTGVVLIVVVGADNVKLYSMLLSIN